MANNTGVIYVLIYVDIILASNSDSLLEQCESALKTAYKIENLGQIKNYLGMHIRKNSDQNYYIINQTAYITQVVKDLQLHKAKISDISLSTGYGNSESPLLPRNEEYRRIIGCLLYISVNTRPDISAAVSILAQKMTMPIEEDWNEIKRIVRYLKGTARTELKLGSDMNEQQLRAYTDANWAGDSHSRRSNTGYVIMFGLGAISWTSKRQSCVALPSTEAEFIALCEGCQELSWIRRILNDFGMTFTQPTIIYEDN
ncbi:PREDICTED: uncharacterized mitochondrial protein AtMg00810-like [Cyphomyrmex costatus]|uniref:uncharacterized mitochondrial protein AtMg00810-like n=1 Tax=Cyphomyrmex costatus TaxID=456900 RepID=UPI0008523839|nr:PREDICTED: uncharacterized mitochondrial protein AtMg00810-like [Cyphomyrmex costatus]